jgi:hypothetical protein
MAVPLQHPRDSLKRVVSGGFGDHRSYQGAIYGRPSRKVILVIVLTALDA